MKMNKKTMYIVIGIVLVLIVGGVSAFMMISGKDEVVTEEKTTKKRKISQPVNLIPVEERPYMQIIPASSAREISIVIEEVKKEAIEVDYALEYNSGSLLQGVEGQIKLATLPVTELLLLGSRSAGGATTYHEDVTGGTIETQFSGPAPYALKSEWKFFETTVKLTELKSRDEKFVLESKSLSTLGVTIIFNNAGFPKGLEGKLVSDPYTVSPAQGKTLAEATATITVESAGSGVKMMGWNGTQWQELESTVSGNQVSTTGPLMETYVAISK